eukprot:1337208-Amorphochlora_amoeboformis.AAC.1
MRSGRLSSTCRGDDGCFRGKFHDQRDITPLTHRQRDSTQRSRVNLAFVRRDRRRVGRDVWDAFSLEIV